jgi:hypothetical protein
MGGILNRGGKRHIGSMHLNLPLIWKAFLFWLLVPGATAVLASAFFWYLLQSYFGGPAEV